MKNILAKIIVLILLLAMINIPNSTYAMDTVISDGDSFIAAANTTLPIDKDALQTTSNDIYNILFTIAVVLAIAIGMIIGIQFMIGSAAEQAKVKETLVPYVIGVFVVFASFTIWKIAVNIGNDVSPTPEGVVTLETSYTITKKYNNQIDIKCDSCDKSCIRSEIPEKCPHCEKRFTKGYTTMTKQSNGSYKCSNCNKTYDNERILSEKDICYNGCKKPFKGLL